MTSRWWGANRPWTSGPRRRAAWTLSLHHLALIYLGVHVLDNMDLTAVSEAAAERNRWEFAVTIAPLIVRGGTGAAVSPIATF